MNKIAFLNLVKKKRLEKNILLKDMAKKLNMSASHYSKIENNKLKLTYEVIKMISETLDIDLNVIKDSQSLKTVIYYD